MCIRDRVKGVPYLKPSLFALEYNSENVSMLPALINTVWMTVLALAVACLLYTSRCV